MTFPTFQGSRTVQSVPTVRSVPRVRLLAAALGCSLLLGCGSTYYSQYRAQHPEWIPAFPEADDTLETTLASLHAPPKRNNILTVRRLEILRTDVEPWQAVDFARVRSGDFRSADDQDYLVIANLTCRGRVELETYVGEKVAYYLLPSNRLAAYDHYEFIEGCVVSNEFRPAEDTTVALERAAQEHVRQGYPASMVHVTELYRRGLAYLSVGRVEDAREMLRRGMEGFDVSARPTPRMQAEAPGISIPIGDEADARWYRDQLVAGLEAAAREPAAP